MMFLEEARQSPQIRAVVFTLVLSTNTVPIDSGRAVMIRMY